MIRATFDTSVRPQDDLYRYVNGRWLDTTPIPDDRVSFSASSELTEKTNADIRAIIEELAAQPNRRAGSREQQVVDLYASMLNEAAIEARGPRRSSRSCGRSTRSIPSRALAERAGRLSATTTAGPFFATVGLDPRNAADRLVHICRRAACCSSATTTSATNRARWRFASEYRRYLTRIFTLTGRADPAGDAAAVLELEIELARAHTHRSPTAPPAPLSRVADERRVPRLRLAGVGPAAGNRSRRRRGGGAAGVLPELRGARAEAAAGDLAGVAGRAVHHGAVAVRQQTTSATRDSISSGRFSRASAR